MAATSKLRHLLLWCWACLGMRHGERLRLFEDTRTEMAQLEAELHKLPQVVAANRSGRLDPKLRFARQVLNLTDASELVRRVPRFLSAPLTSRIAPRHALLRRRGLPHGSELGYADIEKLCSSDSDEPEEAAVCLAFRRGARYAARYGDATTLHDLTAHGWDPQTDRDRRQASTLHWAAGHGHVQASAVLVDAGISVDDREASGASPLHWAIVGVSGNAFGIGARLHAARWLLERGADANATTKDGNTCVHWAAWAGGVDALRLLIARGANLEAANVRGCTISHWAASGGDIETLELLACLGIDLTTPNAAQNTPFEHAVAHARSGAIKWFVDRGIVDDHAALVALRLAQLDPSNKDRQSIAADLAPFVVPYL